MSLGSTYLCAGVHLIGILGRPSDLALYDNAKWPMRDLDTSLSPIVLLSSSSDRYWASVDLPAATAPSWGWFEYISTGATVKFMTVPASFQFKADNRLRADGDSFGHPHGIDLLHRHGIVQQRAAHHSME
ncbi:hypothetical protein DFH27DRAFT_614011 [Peziza echinospora]|nr:hypothetical protein DFH27DRAFT_614011 [Peziza echinospora]